MKTRNGIFILLLSLTLVFASQAMAAEGLAADPGDVALLTGLRTDTDESTCGVIAVRVGPIFLHRQDNDSQGLLYDVGTGAKILDATDLNLGFAVGYDLTVEAQLGAFGGEVRYLGVPKWYEDKDAATPAVICLPYVTPIFAFGAENVPASYESELRSLELNLKWYPTARLAVLAGPRYIGLDEELIMDLDFGGGLAAESSTETVNALFGGQVGVEGVFFTVGGFSADGWLKAGYYLNNMSTDAAITMGGGLIFHSDSKTDRGAFVGDLGINLNYAITPNILLTAGYQLLWIEKAALAPEQITEHDVVSGVGRTVDDSVLYQGIRAGIIVTFDICGKPKPAPAPEPAPVIEPKLEPMTKN
jgi:hypothetical protein